MENKTLHPSESLDLIENMISKAKNHLADDGFNIIFWGWLVFAAALLNYACWVMDIPEGGLVWPILMPAGAFISYFYGRKRNRQSQVKTHIESQVRYIWIGFGIALGIVLSFMPFHGMKTSYFFLMILYGVAIMSSGGLLSFRPLIIGSIFAFLMAAVSVFAPEREQLLLLAASLLCSYIVPGHLLKAKYQSQHV